LLSLWMLVALLTMQTGVAYALPFAGLGGFEIRAASFEGQGLTQYTATADTSTTSSTPVGVTELNSATLTNMQLIKTLNVSTVPGLSGTARFVITTNGETTAQGVTTYVSVIESNRAQFDGLVMFEQNSTDPSQEFRMQANKITLDNAAIRAHYLQADQITFPQLSLVVQYDPDGDGTYEYA